MTSPNADQIISDYLARLDEALVNARCSTHKRRDLLRDIEEHLYAARMQLPVETEAGVQQMLDRIGNPEEIAREASESDRRAAPKSHRAVVLASVAVGTVGLAIVAIIIATLGPSAAPPVSRGTAPSPSAVVPMLVGLKLPEAERVLAEIKLAARPEVSRLLGPVGVVMVQHPAPGIRVSRGTRITLTVSANAFPVCLPTRSAMSDTVSISTNSSNDSFDRSCYYAPAHQRLTLRFTNTIFTLNGHKPIALTLWLYTSQNPAIFVVPGNTASAILDGSKAIVVTPSVVSPHAVTVFMAGLPAGAYDVQAVYLPNCLATLVVQ